jgi:hypothetical protein
MWIKNQHIKKKFKKTKMTTLIELLEVLRNIRDSLYKYIIDGGEQALFNAVMDLYDYLYNFTIFDREIFCEKFQVFYTLLEDFSKEHDDLFAKEIKMCSDITSIRSTYRSSKCL